MTESALLADLASAAGFNAADIAFLTGLQKSTVSRLWTAADWLSKAKGDTLLALIPVVPGLLDHLHAVTTGARFDTLAGELAQLGVQVDRANADTLIRQGTPEETVGSALHAAVTILRGDIELTAQTLARFWGRDQDQVLGALFDRLVVDPAPLLAAGADAAQELLVRADTSFNAFMAFAVVQHHTARSTGAVVSELAPRNDRHAAFLARSTTIGLIIARDDYELAGRYASEVGRSRLAGMVEDWSQATYNRDVAPSASWWVPPSTILHRTADEALREIRTYPPAYVSYLVLCWLPRILSRDPRFAGRAHELATELRRRRDDIDHPTTAHQLEVLVNTLERNPS